MRFIFLIILITTVNLIGQDYKLLKDLNSNKSILVGISNREAYQDSNFSWWFNSEYTNYDVDTKTLSSHTNLFEDKIIKTVLGTWCSDSRREVPRFIKILDFIGFPDDKHLLINVDREKKGLLDEVGYLDIALVPTFIIYENGNEIGRIIETPVLSLEKDLIKILLREN